MISFLVFIVHMYTWDCLIEIESDTPMYIYLLNISRYVMCTKHPYYKTFFTSLLRMTRRELLDMNT